MPSNTREHFLQNIQNQTSRMNDIVQRLLTLVSLEQRERLETRDAVEIDGLLKEMEDRFLAQAQQQQIELQFQRQETAPSSIEGDRFLLAQAIANLLQNSLNFTPSEGTIQVQVSQQTDENEGHQLIIQITDNGPGIPDYALDRVLERFYSLEHPNGRKGTGLGLPFVKQVALLHGGDFHIQNGQKNGVLAVFWIPL